jgi:hypothetical protein
LYFADQLNRNKAFAGLTMILMNIGSRYVVGDLTKMHEYILSSTIFKRIVVFCMFFIGTRDVMVAIMLTFIFTIFLNGLLNETSRYNLIPISWKEQFAQLNTKQALNAGDKPPVSENDYKNALYVIRQYESSVHGKAVDAQAKENARDLVLENNQDIASKALRFPNGSSYLEKNQEDSWQPLDSEEW